jgi:viroplasmin and RNaseH domain-containing protein
MVYMENHINHYEPQHDTNNPISINNQDYVGKPLQYQLKWSGSIRMAIT